MRTSRVVNDARVRHGESRRSGFTPEYEAWAAMKRRCNAKKGLNWDRYGSRGIRVCEEWAASYERFLAYVGRRPAKGYSIDRIDNNRGYEPGNVRWTNQTTQVGNRRNTVVVTHNGETKTLAEWSLQSGIPRTTLDRRIRNGWDFGRALVDPIEVHITKPRKRAKLD